MRSRLNILWLKTAPLRRLDSGGEIRTYQMLRHLSQNHRVTYLALTDPGIAIPNGESADYSQAQVWVDHRVIDKTSTLAPLDFLKSVMTTRYPYAVAKYRSAAMTRAIEETMRNERFDLVVCDFLFPAVNLVRAAGMGTAKTLLFEHNVEAKIWERLHGTAGGLRKRMLGQQWRRMQRVEGELAARFDSVVCVSEEDCATLKEEFGLRNVLGAVPTGVDVAYFRPPEGREKNGEGKKIVFLGSMDWHANIDSVLFFVEKIWPEIKRRVPGVRFEVVGRRPVSRIVALSEKDDRIDVTGDVEDVRPYLWGAEAMVVPLRVGGGTRIKIFEGMAAGVPVISTPIGAEGLAVEEGKEILLASGPEDFANAVVRVLEAPAEGARLAGNALAAVEAKFSWPAAVAAFEDLCYRTVTACDR